MILLETIQKRLSRHVDSRVLRYELDCRYLDRWIREYPDVFPRFIRENRFNIVYNYKLIRYEFHKQ